MLLLQNRSQLTSARGMWQQPCADNHNIGDGEKAHQAAQDARDAVQVVHAAGVAQADHALQERRQEREGHHRDDARRDTDQQRACIGTEGCYNPGYAPVRVRQPFMMCK